MRDPDKDSRLDPASKKIRCEADLAMEAKAILRRIKYGTPTKSQCDRLAEIRQAITDLQKGKNCW